MNGNDSDTLPVVRAYELEDICPGRRWLVDRAGPVRASASLGGAETGQELARTRPPISKPVSAGCVATAASTSRPCPLRHHRAHPADENDVGDVSALLAYLRELQRLFDVAIAVVHHPAKTAAPAPLARTCAARATSTRGTILAYTSTATRTCSVSPPTTAPHHPRPAPGHAARPQPAPLHRPRPACQTRSHHPSAQLLARSRSMPHNRPNQSHLDYRTRPHGAHHLPTTAGHNPPRITRAGTQIAH